MLPGRALRKLNVSNRAERARGSSVLGRELDTNAGRTEKRSRVHLNVNETHFYGFLSLFCVHWEQGAINWRIFISCAKADIAKISHYRKLP